MAFNRLLRVFLPAICLLLIAGCSPSTKLTTSWAVQDGAKTYKNLAVVAMTKNPANRETLERAVALELRSRNIKAIGTTGIFPFADKQDQLKELGMDLSKENIEKVIREKTAANDIDALMIIALLDKKKETERRGGNFGMSMAYPVSTYPYYGYGPWGYYSYAYSEVYSPSYDVEITTYIVETNLYDMATESLVWSGVTETTDPTSVTKESAVFATIIADQLIADGAVKP
jgi:hypothetical protein